MKRSTKPLVLGVPTLVRRCSMPLSVEVELVGVALGPAELAAVVGQDRADRQVEVAVERQHVVVQHRHRRLGLLGDVQEAEGVGAEGVDHRVQVDLADALEAADEEGVGREQLARAPSSRRAAP